LKQERTLTITLRPEHERIIEAQLASGKFRSVDELLDYYLSSIGADVPDKMISEEQFKERAHAAAERIRELRRNVTLDRPEGMSLREYAHIGLKYLRRDSSSSIGLRATKFAFH